MEWNAKSPGQWDWENLLFLNSKTTENPRFQSTTNWNGEADREINVGVLYPSAVGSGFSEFEQIHASSSRSSKSASNNSSSNWDSKTSMLTQEGSQDDSIGKKGLCKAEPVETSPAAEPSAISGEPLLSLKLGKRFYFEDVCPGIDSKKSSSSDIPVARGKKCKPGSQYLPRPSCQVEGCGLDLSSAKDYHRKHRVCESHSKSPKVVVAGLERRFCQQCSRFHAMSEFDDQKRSCRRRLSDHNARRRKPQPGAMQLNSSASSLSSYAGTQIMGPFAFSRNATDNVWQDMHCSKFPETKDFMLKPTKAFAKMHVATMLSDDSNGFLPSKGRGIEDPTTLSDPNATQDVNRALSLLSTNSWSTYQNKSLLQNSNRTIGTTTHSPAITQQRLPFPSSDYWHGSDQQPSNSSAAACIASYSGYDNTNRFQDFQLFSSPFDSGFPCNQLD